MSLLCFWCPKTFTVFFFLHTNTDTHPRTTPNMDQSLRCPLTKNIMEDPVIAEDGRTYERRAIASWVRLNASSPITGQPMGPNLISNEEVLALIRHNEQVAQGVFATRPPAASAFSTSAPAPAPAATAPAPAFQSPVSAASLASQFATVRFFSSCFVSFY